MLNRIKIAALKLVYNGIYRNGHYYSPIPSREEILSEVFIDDQALLNSIDLNEDGQLTNLELFSAYTDKFTFTSKPSNGNLYYSDNPYFNYTDALVLFCFLNVLKPKRIIEIGSGFSSALMLDFKNRFVDDGKLELTFIEPFPDRLHELIGEKYEHLIIKSRVQNIGIELFTKLESNDILFIDSSHVSKYNSDLNFLLFNVIPNLRDGVYLHFHDITFPFEYPINWVKSGIFWNEVYMLRSFLMYNSKFRIQFFCNYINQRHFEIAKAKLPGFLSGGSLWIRKEGN